MKLLLFLALGATASAAVLKTQVPFEISVVDKYLIELAPGETRWVTEEEKWALKRVWVQSTD
jgi:leucyl aminopeptidase